MAMLFVTCSGLLPSRDWLIAQFAADEVGPTVLAARGPGRQVDNGTTICVCFDIGLNKICRLPIRDIELMSPTASFSPNFRNLANFKRHNGAAI